MKVFAYLLAALVAVAAGAGAAQAQSDTYVMHGTVERVDHANNRVFVKGDDGRDYAVDISQGHASRDARTIGQEVTVYGRRTGDNRIEATNITADRDYRGASASERERFRPRGWEQLHGQVVSVEGSEGHRLRMKTDEGNNVIVDMSRLPDRREEMIRALRPGAAITVIGDGDSRTDRFVARNIRFDDKDVNRRALSGGSTAGGSTAGGNRTIRGTVVDVEGSNQHLVRLRTDDGKTVMVDMSSLPDRREDMVRRLKAGASVTVVGDDSRADRFVAREIRFNDRDVSGGAPATSGETRVRGTIDTIHEGVARLKTDDGRTIRVNLNPLGDDRNRVKVGQRVTVVGVYTDKDANKNEMSARTVRVDDAASASPATNRPRNADDCKDKGWASYNNPKFKNQGDCVSYVNAHK